MNRFSFNAAALLSSALFEKVNGTIERSTGTGSISLPAIDPAVKIAKPNGATHFQFSAALAAVDFSVGEESEKNELVCYSLYYKNNTNFLAIDFLGKYFK